MTSRWTMSAACAASSADAASRSQRSASGAGDRRRRAQAVGDRAAGEVLHDDERAARRARRRRRSSRRCGWSQTPRGGARLALEAPAGARRRRRRRGARTLTATSAPEELVLGGPDRRPCRRWRCGARRGSARAGAAMRERRLAGIRRGTRTPRPTGPLHCAAVMAKVCHSCGKGPAFGNSRSHSMVATKRRFDPNLQKVRVLVGRRRGASTSARAASRPARSPRPSSAGARARRGRVASDPSLVRFRAVVEGALAHLESRRAGDQRPQRLPGRRRRHGRQHGAHAARRASPSSTASPPSDDRSIDEIGRDEIVDSVARAALLGARGNSGVILSQLIRGAAEELISRPGELVDPVLVGAGDGARRPSAPTPRSASPPRARCSPSCARWPTAIATELAHMPDDARLGRRRRRRASRTRCIADVLERALAAGEASVKRGPELLPVLREAGVVDAGGYGVTIDLRRRRRRAARRRGARSSSTTRPPRRSRHPEHAVLDLPLLHELRRHRRRPRRRARGRARWRRSATRVLVVGDARTLKVHVHTDEPERATALFDGAGEVSHLDVADMHAQVAERDARRLGRRRRARRRSAAARSRSSSGDGHARAVRRRSASTSLDGGPTLNPSTLRAARRHPRRARRGGRRAAQQRRT